MKINCNIGTFIENSGLRKGYIAEQLKISTDQLGNYSRGKSYPPVPKLMKLAIILGVKMDDLYTYGEDE